MTSLSPEKVSPELRQDLDDLEKKTPELTKTKEAIRIERKRKAVFGMNKKKNSERLEQLTRERDETKRELEEREEELAVLLFEEQQKTDKESVQFAIANKKEEIQELEHEMTRVEEELSQARDALVTTMTEEKDQMKRLFEKKEWELHVLRLQTRSQKNAAKLQAVIERKEAEVGRLSSHMTEVEKDLNCIMAEHNEYCGQLQKTRELVGLKKSRAELEKERTQVDAILKRETAKIMVCFC